MAAFFPRGKDPLMLKIVSVDGRTDTEYRGKNRGRAVMPGGKMNGREKCRSTSGMPGGEMNGRKTQKNE
jgi:hypothetical protein